MTRNTQQLAWVDRREQALCRMEARLLWEFCATLGLPSGRALEPVCRAASERAQRHVDLLRGISSGARRMISALLYPTACRAALDALECVGSAMGIVGGDLVEVSIAPRPTDAWAYLDGIRPVGRGRGRK